MFSFKLSFRITRLSVFVSFFGGVTVDADRLMFGELLKLFVRSSRLSFRPSSGRGVPLEECRLDETGLN